MASEYGNGDVERCWDENAKRWARQVRAGYDLFRDLYSNPAFFEFIGDVAGLEVLDAGCGEGYNTRILAGRGARMTGIDLSRRMIELARVEEEREPVGIRYELASVNDLSLFPDGAFDAAVSTMALMDCADYDGAVRELWRVLRPEGLLAFNICHPCFTYGLPGWDVDESGAVVGVRLGDYFHEGSYTERWSFSAAPEADRTEPFTIIYFHRRLASIINPLCGAGFRIEAIAEPQAAEAACRTHPELRKHRLVPHTLCVRARKDAMGR